MKKFNSLLVAASLLAFVIMPLALVPMGCQTPSAQTVTYNTLAATGMTVNAAYSGYLDLVVKGKIPTNSVPVVSVAYNEFQQVFAAAITLAQFNPNAVAPSSVVASANSVITKINLNQPKP